MAGTGGGLKGLRRFILGVPRLRAIACGLGIAWLSVGAGMYVFQERFVYYPASELVGDPGWEGLAWEDVRLRSADGVQLHAWWLPAAPERAVLLLLHGNAGNISHRLGLLRVLVDLGCSVLIPDYRGYGQSLGVPSEQGTYLDAQAAWEYLLRERGRAPGEILIYGRSLGGGPALWLARRVAARGVILENTFTSIPDMGRHIYPYLPVRLLARIHYPNLERVAGLETPVLFLASRHDRVVPPRHSARLYQRVPAARRRHVELDAGHDDAFLEDAVNYREALLRFLREFPAAREAAAPRNQRGPEPGPEPGIRAGGTRVQ